MRKNVLKMTAAGFLAAAMVFTQGGLAGATVTPDSKFDGTAGDTTSQTGNFSFEGHRSKNVIKAVVPLITNEDIYNAILDPESLIFETLSTEVTGQDSTGADKNAAYYANPAIYAEDYAAYAPGSGTFPEGTLFFKNVTEDETGNLVKSYSTTSDEIQVVNKGTVPLDVKLDVGLTGLDSLEVSDDPTFAKSGRKPAIYLAAVDGEENVTPVKQKVDEDGNAVAGAAEASDITYVAGADESLYHTEYKVDADDPEKNYTFVANNDNDQDGYQRFKFSLTGACNPKGVYSGVNPEIAATVTLAIEEAYETTDEPVATATEDLTDASGAVTGTNIYLFSDKDSTPLIWDVSADATNPNDLFDASKVKVAGPGMKCDEAVEVAGTVEAISADAENYDTADADGKAAIEAEGKRVVIDKAALSGALEAVDEGRLMVKDADGNLTDTLIGGAYRIFYTVGTTQFVGILQLEDPAE